ncbi:putative beta-1,3-galactosyltransferase 13 [Cucurbita argyrosperma subsp. argyrosperma]|nr:putative beta-1,3-galactosyltransferase 13 [Cucurbita argyrosperma subsp. argyrosperma]
MPSSPKLFHARHSSSSPFYSCRSSVLLLCSCLLFGISGFIFGLTSFFTPRLGYSCSNRVPTTVKVVWDRAAGFGGGTGGTGSDVKRYKVMGFVGIQTGFASAGRRRSLRKTWLPSDREGLQRLEEATGLAFRFIIGKTSDKAKMLELKREVAEYDDFVLLDIEEEYSKLPYKTLAFFKAAYALYDSDFYVKADDDIYLRPDRLSLLLAKERTHPQTYIGCMKKGPVFTDPKLKWSVFFFVGLCYVTLLILLCSILLYLSGSALLSHVYEPLSPLLGNDFRMFSNEDVTIGAWMLAMNVNHENEKALCEPDCTPTSIAVWDIPKCSGLCNPEKKLLELHNQESCTKSPTVASDDDS